MCIVCFLVYSITLELLFVVLIEDASHKFYLGKFNSSDDFNLWKVKMRCLLVQHGFVTALEGESKIPEDMTDTVKVNIITKAHHAILLNLVDEVLP